MKLSSPRRRARLSVEYLEHRCVPAAFPLSTQLTTMPAEQGFSLDGFVRDSKTASYVRGVGDVNHDGHDDIAIGVPGPHLTSDGQVFIVYGRAGGFPPHLGLGTLDGTNGFVINGPPEGDGSRVAPAGDFNGDGIDDLLIGAPDAKNGAAFVPGRAYVIFGKAGGFPAALNLADLTASGGLVLVGTNQSGSLGDSLAGVGDVNGDGVDDVLIGGPGYGVQVSPTESRAFAGRAFVVFGSRTGLPASLLTTDLNGTNGFALNGVDNFEAAGKAVARVGDINGDGRNDMLVASTYNGGKAYVVYGAASYPANINLGGLNGANGFIVTTNNSSKIGGEETVAGGGDFNGDGRPDIALGSWNANGGGQTRGAAYIIYGQSSSGFPATFPLTSIGAGLTVPGAIVVGAINGGRLGSSVAFGDLNNDGVSDLIAGAPIADYFLTNNEGSFAGITYVVFGKRGGGGGSVDVLKAQFRAVEYRGFGDFSNAGTSVAPAGDVNGDGAQDVLIGMPNPQNPTDQRPGQGFVIYGKFGRPAANLGSYSPQITATGGGLYDFSLSFANSTPIDVSALGPGDIVVNGPGGIVLQATLVGYNTLTETATYRITPPGGGWDFRDNGTYTIQLVANQIFDVFGAAVPEVTLGTFTVNTSAKVIAVGTNVGGRVQVFTADGTAMYSIDAFPGFAGGVRVAVGDVNNDGIPDVIAAPGLGIKTEVKVFDGGTGLPLVGFGPLLPYGGAWNGGAFVAAADVDGVPGAEIVIGPGRGSVQPVLAINAAGQVVSRFRAYGTNIVGGVRVAAGNLSGDGRAEIVTAAGSGVSSMKAFNQAGRQLWARQAYEAQGGNFITVGDVNGDGTNEVVAGPEGLNSPNIRIFRGTNGVQMLGQLSAYLPNFYQGVRVGVLDVDNDGKLDILVSTAGARTVLVFNWAQKRRIDSFAAFEASYNRGLFVTGG